MIYTPRRLSEFYPKGGVFAYFFFQVFSHFINGISFNAGTFISWPLILCRNFNILNFTPRVVRIGLARAACFDMQAETNFGL